MGKQKLSQRSLNRRKCCCITWQRPAPGGIGRHRAAPGGFGRHRAAPGTGDWRSTGRAGGAFRRIAPGWLGTTKLCSRDQPEVCLWSEDGRRESYRDGRCVPWAVDAVDVVTVCPIVTQHQFIIPTLSSSPPPSFLFSLILEEWTIVDPPPHSLPPPLNTRQPPPNPPPRLSRLVWHTHTHTGWEWRGGVCYTTLLATAHLHIICIPTGFVHRGYSNEPDLFTSPLTTY